MKAIHDALYRAGLTRSSRHRVLGGVCGGLADKVGIDPNAMRLIVVLSMLVLPGSQFLLYPLAWVLMPEDTYRPEGLDPRPASTSVGGTGMRHDDDPRGPVIG